MADLAKLNLGCGKNPLPGYTNVDKYGTPDVLLDLEVFPWPWKTSSVAEIVMNHVLEHLGETTELFIGIIKEIYRVCATGALVHIAVPHPRNDDFIADPTHVRMVTPQLLGLFSKSNNRAWVEAGYANSPLGIYHDVDFELVSSNFVLDEPWATQLARKETTEDEILVAIRRYNNVVKEIRMTMKVVKS
jgi:hypothetical protein